MTLLRGHGPKASASRTALAAATPSGTSGTTAIRLPFRRGTATEGGRFVEPEVLGSQPSHLRRPHPDPVHKLQARAGDRARLDLGGERGERTADQLDNPRSCLGRRTLGERRRVELFVAVLGASNFTYAEATATQHRMVEYLGGTTALRVSHQRSPCGSRGHGVMV